MLGIFFSNGHEQISCDRNGKRDWKSDPAHRRVPRKNQEAQRRAHDLFKRHGILRSRVTQRNAAFWYASGTKVDKLIDIVKFIS